jgi:hypothetical protein
VLQRLERYENEKNTLNLQAQYYEYLKEYLVSRNESGLIVSPSIMGVTDPMLIQTGRGALQPAAAAETTRIHGEGRPAGG